MQHPANQRARHGVLILNHVRVGFESPRAFDHRHHLMDRVRARHFQIALPNLPLGQRHRVDRAQRANMLLPTFTKSSIDFGCDIAERPQIAVLRNESIRRNRKRLVRSTATISLPPWSSTGNCCRFA